MKDFFSIVDSALVNQTFCNGHEWQTYRDIDPDDDDDTVYQFAYSVGYHNGPVCKRCGFHFCIHCHNDYTEPLPKCSGK